MPETGKAQEKSWQFKVVIAQYWRIFTNLQYLRNTLGFCMLWVMIFSMVLINSGTGFCSPMLNRLAMEASSEPMGARVAVFTSLMSMFGVIGSALVSSVYDGKLISLAAILIVLSVVAFILRWRNIDVTCIDV